MKPWYNHILVSRWLPEGTSGDWSIRRVVVEGSRFRWLRYHSEFSNLLIPRVAYTALYRKLADGTEQRVMMDEPQEIKEALAFVERAQGRVLVTGLGLGMVASWLAAKEEVTQVDVVENSQDVIDLVAPHLLSSKIHVIKADAFDFSPTEDYDMAWHDCFYAVPEREEELIDRLPIPHQEVWTPGIAKQPLGRRSFLLGMTVTAAALFFAVSDNVRKVSAAGITFVTQAVGTASPITITAPAAGNSLILVGTSDTSGISAVSGGGVTWVQDLLFNGAGASTHTINVWHGHNSSGAGTSITITGGGRSNLVGGNVSEWSGLTNAANENTNNSASVGSTAPTTNTVTPASAANLLIGGATWGGNFYSSGPDSGFNRLTNTTSSGVLANLESAYKIQAAATVGGTNYVLSSSSSWSGGVVAFGGTSAGPTTAQRSAGFWSVNE